ncbi:hypothetical protein [Clostridium saccharobutylicum]|uniref:Uncharacterized protein n=1 Tax=Clostridium saccharobutylicum DSM 13864 TaxID=1345695 RepID=U5MT91_CLOSA|nr:hypothetical protein [Clostridium saccharobutylicum]AGX43979.1 hypothetical protein CLSA_c30120 [Clostridium saccharobutylicum DSM 13864]AQR91275.1 hypothetical protein CLOSC_29990 [Clostridium saccharobutylicum]AQS01179.1 hypothetical protein CSACC_30060 [Clostridium saccharobutylicum]AQS15162.1 hypothetical protein CLOSACC_30060 [Clostridium saccharobutylicum]MBA2905289.1 hypothetical protein [Clostridium saccharobutylicum]
MSKKLNIIEAMKMPIGTEFEVIFNGEKISNNTMIISLALTRTKEYKIIDWKFHPKDTVMKPYDFLINGVFIPIQQPVSFMEVVKTKRKVKVECEGYFKVREYRCLHEILQKIIDNNFGEEDKALNNFITKGKWYIEESGADSNDQ